MKKYETGTTGVNLNAKNARQLSNTASTIITNGTDDKNESETTSYVQALSLGLRNAPAKDNSTRD